MNPLGACLPSDCSKSTVPNGLESFWVFGGVGWGGGGQGTNKYIGQGVKKLKNKNFDYF